MGARSIYSGADLVPGATQEGSGFGIQRLLLRGVPNAYERINGIELDSYYFVVDASALDRVEVVRGPATALYGVTGSFGGEINSVLKRPTKETHVQAGFETGTWEKAVYTADVSGTVPGTGGALTGRISDTYIGSTPELNISGINNRKEVLLASLSYEFSPRTSVTVWHYHDDRHEDPYDGGALFQLPNGKLALPPDSLADRFYYSNPAQSNEHTQVNTSVLEFVHTLANDWKIKSTTLFVDTKQQISYFYPFGPFGAYGAPQNEISIYTYDIARHSEDLITDLSLGGDFQWRGRKQSFYAAIEGEDDVEPNQFALLNSQFTGLANAFQGGQQVYANGAPWLPIDRSELGIRNVENTVIRNGKAQSPTTVASRRPCQPAAGWVVPLRQGDGHNSD